MAAHTRICLIGAESTGKSSLAEELARRFGGVVVPEFAREYALRVARPLDFFDAFPIARGQIANQDRLTSSASGVVILDTDLVSTVVYCRYYWGVCADWIEREAARRLADLYLFLDIDVPWIADPARDASANREHVHAEFESALHEFKVRHVTIGGNWEERKRKAIEAIHAAVDRRGGGGEGR